ncbi:MAG TPA: hypothetical protein VIT23_16310 [Terrimicrobiaceae bacterium]
MKATFSSQSLTRLVLLFAKERTASIILGRIIDARVLKRTIEKPRVFPTLMVAQGSPIYASQASCTKTIAIHLETSGGIFSDIPQPKVLSFMTNDLFELN